MWEHLLAQMLQLEPGLKASYFFEGTNIRAWLFRIVRNSSINRCRKETREPGTEIAPGWTCRLCAGAGAGAPGLTNTKEKQ